MIVGFFKKKNKHPKFETKLTLDLIPIPKIFLLFSFSGLVVIPCSLKSCINNAKCAFRSGSVECRCPDVSECSAEPSPLCGSDGRTHKMYKNKCIMDVESCRTGNNIYRVSSEKCGKLVLFSIVSELLE